MLIDNFRLSFNIITLINSELKLNCYQFYITDEANRNAYYLDWQIKFF